MIGGGYYHQNKRITSFESALEAIQEIARQEDPDKKVTFITLAYVTDYRDTTYVLRVWEKEGFNSVNEFSGHVDSFGKNLIAHIESDEFSEEPRILRDILLQLLRKSDLLPKLIGTAMIYRVG